MHESDFGDHILDGPLELVLPVFDVPEPGADIFGGVGLSLVGQCLGFGDCLLARVLHAVAVFAIRETLNFRGSEGGD